MLRSIDAVMAHPISISRPLVVTPFIKEDGEVVIDATCQRVR